MNRSGLAGQARGFIMLSHNTMPQCLCLMASVRS